MELRGYRKVITEVILLILFGLTTIQIFTSSKIYASDCAANTVISAGCTCSGRVGLEVAITQENLDIAQSYDSTALIGLLFCADDDVYDEMISGGIQSQCAPNSKINNCICNTNGGINQIFVVDNTNLLTMQTFDPSLNPGDQYCAGFTRKDQIQRELDRLQAVINVALPAVAAPAARGDFRYIPQYGGQCIANFGTCNPGKKNIKESILNGNIKLMGVGLAELENLVTSKGKNLSELCINQDRTFITRIADGSLGINGYWIATNPIEGGVAWEAQEAPCSGTLVDVLGCQKGVYGFCPSDYQFVTPVNLVGDRDNYQFSGICCKKTDKSGISVSPYSTGTDEECYAKDGTKLDVDRVRGTDSTFLGGDLYKDGQQTRFQDENNYAAGKLFDTTISITKSNSSCPPQYANGCTLGDNDDVHKSLEFETQIGWTCKKCFLPGEAMRLDEESQKLHVCDPTQANNFREENLINGNINDTIAYLQADIENQPELKSCREQGGLYIAIGCVDPTPIGIITGAIRISFGVLGGVALLQIILAGIAYQSGEEARIQAARNRVFATLGGVSLLVFSVLVLRIIGVNVLDVVPSTFF